MTIEYFDFGVKPDIEIPDEDDVFDGTQLGLQAAEDLAD